MKYMYVLFITLFASAIVALGGGYLTRSVTTTTDDLKNIEFTSDTPLSLESVMVTMATEAANTCKIYAVIGSVSNLIYDEGSGIFNTALWTSYGSGVRMSKGDSISVANDNINTATITVSYSYFTTVSEYD